MDQSTLQTISVTNQIPRTDTTVWHVYRPTVQLIRDLSCIYTYHYIYYIYNILSITQIKPWNTGEIQTKLTELRNKITAIYTLKYIKL